MRSGKTPAVILCDGPAGVNVIRALHHAGIASVAVLFNDSATAVSHVPWKKIAVDGDDRQEKEANLLAILRKMPADGRPPLLVTSDGLLDFLCTHREELERKFSLLMPSSELVRTLNDKADETALVAKLGYALPRTVYPLPATAAELEERLRFPIIVKLRRHEFWSVLGQKNVVVRTSQELRSLYAAKHSELHFLIAQELIEGAGPSWVCTAAFDRNHRLISLSTKEKVRLLPFPYGHTTIAMSAPNPELRETIEQLGLAMGCVGAAGFEFRRDDSDGLHKYIEMNPRFGAGAASAAYDLAIGVPTAYLAYRLAADLPTTPHVGQRDGIVYRELDMDVISRLRNGEGPASILRQHLLLCLRHKIHDSHASLTDPLPGLQIWFGWLRRFARKLHRTWFGLPAAVPAANEIRP